MSINPLSTSSLLQHFAYSHLLGCLGWLRRHSTTSLLTAAVLAVACSGIGNCQNDDANTEEKRGTAIIHKEKASPDCCANKKKVPTEKAVSLESRGSEMQAGRGSVATRHAAHVPY